MIPARYRFAAILLRALRTSTHEARNMRTDARARAHGRNRNKEEEERIGVWALSVAFLVSKYRVVLHLINKKRI